MQYTDIFYSIYKFKRPFCAPSHDSASILSAGRGPMLCESENCSLSKIRHVKLFVQKVLTEVQGMKRNAKKTLE